MVESLPKGGRPFNRAIRMHNLHTSRDVSTRVPALVLVQWQGGGDGGGGGVEDGGGGVSIVLQL